MNFIASRRDFWRYSLDEFVAALDESGGRRSFKLSALAGEPDDVLGRLVPMIMEVSCVGTDGGCFVLRRPGGHTDVLFAIGSRDEEVWSLMDGKMTLQQIADALAFDWKDTRDGAFVQVRRVFLHLVGTGICLPRNTLE